VKKKQTVLKTRKSMGDGHGDDSSDDFKPVAKKKAVKGKEKEIVKRVVKKPVDDEIEEVAGPVKKAATKRKADVKVPAKRRSIEKDSLPTKRAKYIEVDSGSDESGSMFVDD